MRQFAVLAILLAGLCWALSSLGVFRARGPGQHAVTFEVDGSASTAVVTYTLPEGTHTHPEDIRVPWKKTLTFTGPLTVILTVGNPSQTGEIRCALLLDGAEWKEEKAAAPRDKASCAGIVP